MSLGTVYPWTMGSSLYFYSWIMATFTQCKYFRQNKYSTGFSLISPGEPGRQVLSDHLATCLILQTEKTDARKSGDKPKVKCQAATAQP
jgi:hypothetical protein